MTIFTVKMPDVGEGVTEAEIVTWHVQAGDQVEEDQDLLDVMTDKATVEIPSPVAGVVKRVSGSQGEAIAVGTIIVEIETNAVSATDDNNRLTYEIDDAPVPSEISIPKETRAPRSKDASGKPIASPAVRKLSSEMNIDLRSITGTGPGGRILKGDLLALSNDPSKVHSPTKDVKPVRTTKLVGLRRRIAQNMEKAASVPSITYVEEIDVTALESLRSHLNERRADNQEKLSILPFIALAISKAVKAYSQTNAHYDASTETLSEFSETHIGIATATPNGLMVPVVKRIQQKDIWTIASEIKRLSTECRDQKIKREDLTGSTITITSLGALGGVVTTPILNRPETTIVGVNKIIKRPTYDTHGNIVPGMFMNLSSTFDHRIVDGFEAASFTQIIKEALEQPATLFI